ncbi:MAG: hypothetical protein MJZ41_14870 [Bacteroidaceae bacterium]|nr:hypothetical protein [Bacteroidaceae bacterium]
MLFSLEKDDFAAFTMLIVKSHLQVVLAPQLNCCLWTVASLLTKGTQAAGKLSRKAWR